MELLARNGFKSYSVGIRIRSKVFHIISALKKHKGVYRSVHFDKGLQIYWKKTPTEALVIYF